MSDTNGFARALRGQTPKPTRESSLGRVWGVAEDPRRRAGDREAHHKGACMPPSVGENRAPLLILMAPALRRRTLPNNAEVPLVYKRNRPVGVSGTPFRTTPVVKYLNTLRVQAWFRPVGVSGASFRITPVVKSSNTLRVSLQKTISSPLYKLSNYYYYQRCL
ncbi:MAG: hypothetical protein LBK25_04310 [Treponema sp.]|nr:hypothetical protein [Treponema sp.]